MTRSELALDTSVTIAHLLSSHPQHAAVRRRLAGLRPLLTSHSLAETYSVLTRLPGDARLSPVDAVTLIDANYPEVLPLPPETAIRVHAVLHEHGVAGGAVYDGLVALAARAAGVALATRDTRAAATYEALDAQVEFIADR